MSFFGTLIYIFLLDWNFHICLSFSLDLSYMFVFYVALNNPFCLGTLYKPQTDQTLRFISTRNFKRTK